MLALEQLRIRAAQPPGDLGERGLVEPLFLGCGWVLSRPRAPAQDDVELDIRRLSRRLREVDETGTVIAGDIYIGDDEAGLANFNAVVWTCY
jgi:hypothetical protein